MVSLLSFSRASGPQRALCKYLDSSSLFHSSYKPNTIIPYFKPHSRFEKEYSLLYKIRRNALFLSSPSPSISRNSRLGADPVENSPRLGRTSRALFPANGRNPRMAEIHQTHGRDAALRFVSQSLQRVFTTIPFDTVNRTSEGTGQTLGEELVLAFT